MQINKLPDGTMQSLRRVKALLPEHFEKYPTSNAWCGVFTENCSNGKFETIDYFRDRNVFVVDDKIEVPYDEV